MGTKGESEDPAVDLFGRWLEHHAGESVPATSSDLTRPAPAAATPTAPVSTSPSPSPSPKARTAPATAPTPTSHRPRTSTPRPQTPAGSGANALVFPPKRGTRAAIGLLLLASLVASGIATAMAFEERTTFSIGVATTLGVLTLVLYGVRAGAATTYLTVRGGQLEVVRGGSRHVFDLSSRYTRIEEFGRPGQRGWKVAFARYDAPPLVIDSSVVDAAEFSDVLRRYRPD